MKHLAIAVLVASLAGHALAVQLSRITMRIDPVVPGEFQWTQTSFGLDTEATDAYDTVIDSHWPPVPPYMEARMVTKAPDDQGDDLMIDVRDGAGGYADPALAEVWPYVFIKLYGGEFKQGRLTWDLSGAGPYDYLLRDRSSGAEIAWLEPGGELLIDIGRGGAGGEYILEAYVIPEPGSLLLLGSALAATLAFRRKAA